MGLFSGIGRALKGAVRGSLPFLKKGAQGFQDAGNALGLTGIPGSVLESMNAVSRIREAEKKKKEEEEERKRQEERRNIDEQQKTSKDTYKEDMQRRKDELYLTLQQAKINSYNNKQGYKGEHAPRHSEGEGRAESATRSSQPSWEQRQRAQQNAQLSRTIGNPEDLAKFIDNPDEMKKYLKNDTSKAQVRTPFGSFGIPGTAKRGNKAMIDWDRYNKDHQKASIPGVSPGQKKSVSFGEFVTRTIKNNPEIDPVRDHKKLMRLYEMQR